MDGDRAGLRRRTGPRPAGRATPEEARCLGRYASRTAPGSTELAARLGLPARVAYITGDDLAPVIGDLQAAGHEFTNTGTGQPLAKADLPVVTANAYLALNFVVHGLLAPGVSATTRPDAQAKGLGEYLRSRVVTAPAGLISR